MANVRTLNKDKYKISGYRFRELYYFCLQYEEWRAAINDIQPIKGISYSGVPSSGVPGNRTMHAAIESAEYARKCAAVEAAARAADPELYEYIMYAVTHDNVTFNFLKNQKNIPCERDRYYNSRRKFYFHLDKILK